MNPDKQDRLSRLTERQQLFLANLDGRIASMDKRQYPMPQDDDMPPEVIERLKAGQQ